MKILVTEPLHEAGIEKLMEIGEVEKATDLQKSELLEKIRDAYVLIVRSRTEVDKDVVGAAEKLKVIGRAGVGLDNIDLDAASSKGIIVVNTPEASSIAVAELTFGLMLALLRRIVAANNTVKMGGWNRDRFMGSELYGKRLGIIGLGRIGSQVAIRAIAFGMEVIAYDPYITEEITDRVGAKLKPLNELLDSSDIITIHAPLTEETRHLIAEKELKFMKDSAVLINCSRGGIVDETALYNAIVKREIAGAALDVFESEPPPETPLSKLENVVVTPHLGASTEEAQRNSSLMVAEKIRDILLAKWKVMLKQPPTTK